MLVDTGAELSVAKPVVCYAKPRTPQDAFLVNVDSNGGEKRAGRPAFVQVQRADGIWLELPVTVERRMVAWNQRTGPLQTSANVVMLMGLCHIEKLRPDLNAMVAMRCRNMRNTMALANVNDGSQDVSSIVYKMPLAESVKGILQPKVLASHLPKCATSGGAQ